MVFFHFSFASLISRVWSNIISLSSPSFLQTKNHQRFMGFSNSTSSRFLHIIEYRRPFKKCHNQMVNQHSYSWKFAQLLIVLTKLSLLTSSTNQYFQFFLLCQYKIKPIHNNQNSSKPDKICVISKVIHKHGTKLKQIQNSNKPKKKKKNPNNAYLSKSWSVQQRQWMLT